MRGQNPKNNAPTKAQKKKKKKQEKARIRCIVGEAGNLHKLHFLVYFYEIRFWVKRWEGEEKEHKNGRTKMKPQESKRAETMVCPPIREQGKREPKCMILREEEEEEEEEI